MKDGVLNIAFIVISIFLIFCLFGDIRNLFNKNSETFASCNKLDNIIKQIDDKTSTAINEINKNKKIKDTACEANRLIKELKKYQDMKKPPVEEEKEDEYDLYYESCRNECKKQYDKYLKSCKKQTNSEESS